MSVTGTETAIGAARRPAAERAPHLFVVLEGQRPLAGGLRVCLHDIDELVIGRGGERSATLTGRVVDVRVPDRRMSSTHARLRPTLDGWELADAGSKNGCRVDGEAVARAPLRDGAILELGQTVLMFRAALAADDNADSATLAPRAGIVTLLPGFAAALAELEQLAPTLVSLVLTGESGVGKEIVARAIHAASGRRGELVAVNCAALPAGLVEAELFGHKKGAFSGAVDDRSGLVRAAHGGTLLLDEVGDLPAAAQAALLRVLQEREVVAVGETRPVAVDVRIIAATHRDLPAMVAAGTFRADLWARLAGHATRLPPLRERREDLGVLVAALLARHAGARAGALTLTADAARTLVTADWPLNVRALEKALEAALALAADGAIDVEHLPLILSEARRAESKDAELRARLVALLTEHRGNITQVARAMGKARMQVQRWLRRFDLDASTFR